jgi:hypothetical protein
MMGVQATTQAAGGGNMLHTPAPTVEAQSFGYTLANDAKTRSFVMASKYGKGGIFRCTKDIRENVARAELERTLSMLTQTRNNLAQAISNLEMINDDPDSPRTLQEERINGMFEVQNSITSAITQLQTSTALMTTSCETRCNGMSSMLAETSGPSEFNYDADGNLTIKEATSSGSSYACKEFDAASDFDPMAFLGKPGSINVETMLGGVSKRVGELTERVLNAVVTADRAIEMAEITTNIGRSVEDFGEDYWGGGGNQSVGGDISQCIRDGTGKCGGMAPCMTRIINNAAEKLNQNNPNANTLNQIQDLINSILGIMDSYNCTDSRNNRTRPPVCNIGTGKFAIANISSCASLIGQRTNGSSGGNYNANECPKEAISSLMAWRGELDRNGVVDILRNHNITTQQELDTCISEARKQGFTFKSASSQPSQR